MKEKEYEKILKALANHRRLLILKFLKTGKGKSVGSIAQEIKLSFKATSKHLSILYAKNLVEREQTSLQMHYRLANPLPSLVRFVLSRL